MLVPFPALSILGSRFGLESTCLPVSAAVMIAAMTLFMCFLDYAFLLVIQMDGYEFHIFSICRASLLLGTLKRKEIQPTSQLSAFPDFAFKPVEEECLWWGVRPVRQQHPVPVQHKRLQVITMQMRVFQCLVVALVNVKSIADEILFHHVKKLSAIQQSAFLLVSFQFGKLYLFQEKACGNVPHRFSYEVV